jgi:hypothetical protein
MKLVDLDPRWYACGDSPDIVGVTFECPCCLGKPDATRIGVMFVEEIDKDGLPNQIHWARNEKKWHRSGDTFETLTLTPSIDASAVGHWHGHITNGDAS